MNAAHARIRIALLCGLHLTVLAASLGFGPYHGVGLWVAACIGLLTGQASLTALWAIFGSGRLSVRMLASLAVVATLAWSAGYMERGNSGQFWLWYGLFATAGLVTAAPFVVLRARGCQVSLPAAGGASAPPEALQFSIRDLALWTFAAALALGGFRWMAALTPLYRRPEQSDLWTILVFGSVFAAVGVVAAWAALGARLAPLRIAACCVVTALSGPAIAVLTDREADLFIATTATEGAVVLASLLVLRTAGYQLLGVRPTTSA